MNRITFETPEHYSFSTVLQVRITDINYGNHMGHDATLSLLHEARMRMLQDKGFSEMDVGGVGLTMADVGVQFKSEVFYPATLRCELAILHIGRTGFEVFYKLTRLEDDKVVIIAKTGIVCFDYTTRRVARVPEVFRAAFSEPA